MGLTSLPPDGGGLSLTSLTCVHYAVGDLVGKALAYSSLLPYAILLFQASKVYCRRELHEAVILLGLLSTEATARTLKHLLAQPRPAATCAALGVCASHGMPSSHTAMAFAALAISASLAFTLRRKRQRVPNLTAALEVAALATGAAAVAASRMYLGYHSVAQVAAGAVVGLVSGLATVHTLHACGAWLKLLLHVPLLEALGFKDTWGVGDVLRMEQWLYGSRQQQGHQQHQPPRQQQH